AFDAAAKSDLRNAMTAQEAFFADNQTYTTDETQLEWEASQGVTLTINSADGTGYDMTSSHSSSSNSWCVSTQIPTRRVGAGSVLLLLDQAGANPLAIQRVVVPETNG
ncbi:MAG: hypothetical protein L0229_03965, partial [Blastocatellia bacterium]|nr:hypothetical protein [Blastocatellia bacterium]